MRQAAAFVEAIGHFVAGVFLVNPHGVMIHANRSGEKDDRGWRSGQHFGKGGELAAVDAAGEPDAQAGLLGCAATSPSVDRNGGAARRSRRPTATPPCSKPARDAKRPSTTCCIGPVRARDQGRPRHIMIGAAAQLFGSPPPRCGWSAPSSK